MNKHSYYLLFALLFLAFGSQAQEEDEIFEEEIDIPVETALPQSGVAYGIKGGLTIGTQKWNGLDRNALFSYHGDLFVEFLGAWKTRREDGRGGRRSGFGINLGYHRKGSAIWGSFVDINNNFRTYYVPNVFHNICLGANGKAAFQMTKASAFTAGFGFIVEYTAAYSTPSVIGLDNYVRRFGYGIWLGGGFEVALPKVPMSAIFEVSITPNLSRQIYVPPGVPFVYYDATGNQQTVPSQEQKVTNLVFEVSVGLRIDPPRQ